MSQQEIFIKVSLNIVRTLERAHRHQEEVQEAYWESGTEASVVQILDCQPHLRLQKSRSYQALRGFERLELDEENYGAQACDKGFI